MDRANHKKTIVAGGLAFILSLGTVQAGSQYDVKLERAAMDLVARRIGSIRPGLAYDVGISRLVAPSRKPATDLAPLPSARRANEFWLPKGKDKVARTKSSGSFQMIGEPADKPAGEAHAPRRGAIPKVLKF
jgi:hypothetical protein